MVASDDQVVMVLHSDFLEDRFFLLYALHIILLPWIILYIS
jgi:hypothetical protein